MAPRIGHSHSLKFRAHDSKPIELPIVRKKNERCVIRYPSGPINKYEQVFADPQVRHRGLWESVPLAGGGTAPAIASPLRLSDTPVEYRRPAPTLGQHTTEILSTVLGKSAEEIQRLAGVIE
jgi:crotonobetainyl-CoA:carnitine CoA-transferase CaiB-like acyl-CoA transferase